MKNLSFPQQYFYKVGSSDNWSDIYDFRTRSMRIDPSETLHFAIMADQGTAIPMGNSRFLFNYV